MKYWIWIVVVCLVGSLVMLVPLVGLVEVGEYDFEVGEKVVFELTGEKIMVLKRAMNNQYIVRLQNGRKITCQRFEIRSAK